VSPRIEWSKARYPTAPVETRVGWPTARVGRQKVGESPEGSQGSRRDPMQSIPGEPSHGL
jgi:hypothetical protein